MAHTHNPAEIDLARIEWEAARDRAETLRRAWQDAHQAAHHAYRTYMRTVGAPDGRIIEGPRQ